MSKFHVNPETGIVGRCSAKIKCDFEDIGAEHFDNKADAQKASEKILKEQLGEVSRKSKRSNKAADVNIQEVAAIGFYSTEEDVDKTNYNLVVEFPDLLSDEDRLKFFKNPNNPKMKELVSKNIAEKVDEILYAERLNRITSANIFMKAYSAGLDISPELEEAFEKEWEDDESVAGRRQKEIKLARLNKNLEEGKFENDSLEETYRIRNKLEEDLKYRGRNNPLNIAIAEAATLSEVTERLGTPTEEDVKEARRNVAIQYANDHFEYRWEKVMGNKRRTDKSRDNYYEQIEELAKNDKYFFFDEKLSNNAQKIADSKFFARRFKEGYLTPASMAVEKRFEQKWNTGGAERAENRLREIVELEDDFLNGKISARKIVGSGLINPNKMAKEYLKAEVTKAYENYTTRGRSDTTTIMKLRLEGTLPNGKTIM